MSVSRTVCLGLFVSALVAGAARDARAESIDTVYLLDGGRLRGTVMIESRDGVRILLLDGTVQQVPPANVKLVEYASEAQPPPSNVEVEPAPDVSEAPRDTRRPRSAGRSKLSGGFGSIGGQLGGGLFASTDEDAVLHGEPAGVFTGGIGFSVGYFVTPKLSLGGAGLFQPGVGVAKGDIAANIGGTAGLELQYFVRGGPGLVVSSMVGFGGGGAIDVTGGLGPAVDFGLRYLFSSREGRAMHGDIGGKLIGKMANWDGEVKGVYVDLVLTSSVNFL